MLAAVAAVVFFLIRARSKKGGTPATRHQNLDYRPEAKPVSPLIKQTLPRPVVRAGVLPLPETGSVVEGKADITASLLALVKKYSLDQFTIATSDGLLFASSIGESAYGDAARFGGRSGEMDPSELPGVTLFSVTHKGSVLTGIIRTHLQIPAEKRRMIEQDTQDILNWWI